MASVSLALGTGTCSRGGSIILPVTIVSTAAATALQFTFSYTSDVVAVAASAGPSMTGTASKMLATNTATMLVFGLNTSTIPDGTLLLATFSINPFLFAQFTTITFTGAVVSDASANSLPVTTNTGTVWVVQPLSTSTQTLPSIARISATPARTITGLANITVANTSANRTVLGHARVTAQTTHTILARASVANIVTTRTLLGHGRIRLTSTQTVLGRANISVANTATTRTLLGRSRITSSAAPPHAPTQNILGVASIFNSVTRTVLGRASIDHTVPGPTSITTTAIGVVV